jgi:Protein of unknown function (DUF3298).
MNRKSIILFFSILISLSFFSCTSKTVKTTEKDLVKRYYLAKDTTKGSLSIDIEVEIPTAFADTNVLKSIRKTVITNLFGEEYVKFPNDSIVNFFSSELYANYKADYQPLMNSKDSTGRYSFNNEHVISGFSLLGDKIIYVYGVERYADMGGAHGNETRNYFNFDLKTGKLIAEKDLFKAGYEKALSDLLKLRILEEAKEMANEKNSESVIDLEDTDYWTESIKGNSNFYITDESINYVFNPYEIAPYYMGQTEVKLPFNRLKQLLKPNSIIAYLVEKQAKLASK